MSGDTARFFVADLVPGLAAKDLLTWLGALRNLELDAPGDFVFVILHEVHVGEVRVLVFLGCRGGRPVSLDLEPAAVEEVECRIDRPVALLFFRVFIDMEPGIELGRHLEA